MPRFGTRFGILYILYSDVVWDLRVWEIYPLWRFMMNFGNSRFQRCNFTAESVQESVSYLKAFSPCSSSSPFNFDTLPSKMQFFAALLVLAVSTTAAPSHDPVFAPRLKRPNLGDVWHVNSTQLVTWDISGMKKGDQSLGQIFVGYPINATSVHIIWSELFE